MSGRCHGDEIVEAVVGEDLECILAYTACASPDQNRGVCGWRNIVVWFGPGEREVQGVGYCVEDCYEVYWDS